MSKAVDIISCLSDDDDDGDQDAPRKVSLDPADKGGKLKEDPSDDEIEVMDGESYRTQASATAVSVSNVASKSADNDEEELEIVGTNNEQRLPHNRQNCLDFRFCASNSNGKSGGGGNPSDNAKFCSLCYCYVCDKPASECDNWVGGSKGICSDVVAAADGGGKRGDADVDCTKPHMNHFNATDKGSQSTLWKNMRNAVKKGKDPSTVSATLDESYNLDAPNASLQQYLQNYGVYMPNSYDAAMLQMAMYHHHPSARYSRGGRNRTYTIHSGAAMSAAMSAAVAAMSGGATAASARSSSRGRSRSRAVSNNSVARAVLSTAAAAASSRGAQRNRPEQREESGNKRPAPHDHQARMRTQQMLEDLYGG